jgi:phage-related minor tail protein
MLQTDKAFQEALQMLRNWLDFLEKEKKELETEAEALKRAQKKSSQGAVSVEAESPGLHEDELDWV